jgi:hypothetical protein
LIITALLPLMVIAQKDCGFKDFGTVSKVYARYEEVPNHKKDQETSYVIKGMMPVYFIEDSAKFYLTGIDTLLILSYEVRQLPFDVAIEKEDKYYIFHAFQDGQHYDVHVTNLEIIIAPTGKEIWPKIVRIYTINKTNL